MPNHVHALVQVRPEHSLDRITSFVEIVHGKAANGLLGRTGAFWAPEYFDRFMRDEEHLARRPQLISKEIRVKAGLCANIP